MKQDPDIEPPVLESAAPGRLSAVWLLPLLALAGALAIGWSAWSARGPAIEIVFDDAAGVRAGETTLRSRDIEIGRVEDVRFAEDARRVIVTARLSPEIAPLLDGDTQFWVVRPQITTRGISGLGSVLSGVHIEASWDDTRGEPARRFTGLAEAPLTPPNTPGLRIRLQAVDGGSVAIGAPVVFKGLEVGRIESRELSPADDTVVFEAFIRAPFDARITAATRFWNVSGFDVQIGAEGASLRVDSLLSLLQGGVGFDTVAAAPDPAPAADGAVFRLHRSQTAARESLLDGDAQDVARLTVAFEGSVRGLRVGAPVEYRGIRVGAVEDIAFSIGPDASVQLAATLAVQPRRLGVAGRDAAMAFITDAAARGMRAKLQSASLLTGALFVGLVEDAGGPTTFDADARPHPVLETAPSDFEAFAASAEGVMERINALPVEALIAAATTLMTDLSAIAAAPATRALPADLSRALGTVDALASDPAMTDAPAAFAEAMRAARTLLAQLDEAGAAAQLAAALTDGRAAMASASTAAAALEQAAERLPRLLAALTQAATRADAALASFEVGSELNYEAVTALREVRDAARAVTALTSAVDRRPNSLILGR